MVALMSALSLVKIPSIMLGAMFKINMKSRVMQKLKTDIFLIILKTSLCLPWPTSVLTKDWFNTHPCTVYLGDIKPSHTKDKRIVEL
jgi:hypothetical protein